MGVYMVGKFWHNKLSLDEFFLEKTTHEKINGHRELTVTICEMYVYIILLSYNYGPNRWPMWKK